MRTLGIVLLVLASVLTAQRARRPGAAASRLQWLSLGFVAAALGLAIWTVVRMVRDHRRDDRALAPATSWSAPEPQRRTA